MLDLEDRILTLPYLRVKIQTKVGPGGGEGGGIFFFTSIICRVVLTTAKREVALPTHV